mmetsp:Transcript_18596/g.74237  ORF Transcript_18596/g.74237 Transcript_18596/m.74237 type:complete len:296 (-) Transcript_18596:80-967(-)
MDTALSSHGTRRCRKQTPRTDNVRRFLPGTVTKRQHRAARQVQLGEERDAARCAARRGRRRRRDGRRAQNLNSSAAATRSSAIVRQDDAQGLLHIDGRRHRRGHVIIERRARRRRARAGDAARRRARPAPRRHARGPHERQESDQGDGQDPRAAAQRDGEESLQQFRQSQAATAPHEGAHARARRSVGVARRLQRVREQDDARHLSGWEGRARARRSGRDGRSLLLRGQLRHAPRVSAMRPTLGQSSGKREKPRRSDILGHRGSGSEVRLHRPMLLALTKGDRSGLPPFFERYLI